MSTRRSILAGLGVAASFAPLSFLAAQAETANPQRRTLGAQYFPNSVLLTHEGHRVKFYDDLIKDKLVAINMIYTECNGSCPVSTANLQHVQKALGERVGRDIFMYSITLTPEHDTPRVLKKYVEERGIGPGWLFLTGKPADIELIRRKLGFYERDPEVDRDRSQHTGMVRIGNDAYDRWHMTPALGKPELIVAAILNAYRGSRPA
jgi:protein SCO1/2